MKPERKKTFALGRAAVVIILTFCFLLLLSRGFVTSGDDWYFTSRDTGESLIDALQNGFANARGHYISTNGRLLGNALSRIVGSSDLWRELLRCGIILVVLLQICRMAKIRSFKAYLLALTLVIALPSDIYTQSYAWAAGFFNYVPPIMMIFAYIFRVDRLLEREGDSAMLGLGMLLLGFTTQFYVENVTVGMCLFSGIVLVWYAITHKKLSISLCGHFVGAVLGCILMLSAPGYSNVNTEGYRQVSQNFEELMKTVQTNFFQITGYLTERNWVVIGGLTVVCLLLLLRTREKGFAHKAAMVCLMVCPVYFYANYNILSTLRCVEWIKNLTFWLDVAFNAAYLLAVLAAVLLGVEDAVRKRRGVLCILAVPMIFGPLVAVTPIGPRCLYIPYMLLVCLLLVLGVELAEKLPREIGKPLGKPVALMCCAVLVCYLWVSVWNGYCEMVRLDQIETAMETGAETVDLPSYPYTDYVHNGNGGAVRYYYYYQEPGDLTFNFVPYAQWIGD